MPLLRWCSLRPQGPSNLAAIRFSAPVHISSLVVYPNGAKPFNDAQEIVAETEPDAFFLDIFFHAQPLHPSAGPREKQRAPNALVPTSIAYTGSQMSYVVDMGTEYATRLMIVKGNFEVLSLAIYGNVVAEPPPVLSYEPRPLPIPEPFPLSKSIDPASSPRPGELAEQLLSLMPNSPQLPLVARLMFCLKPSEEDWDDPDFPYLYADLEDKDSDFDLEGIVNSASRPVRDDLTEDNFLTLVERINDFLSPEDSGQAYYIAKLLSIAAPQQPEMAQILLEKIDVQTIFDGNTLDDENTMLCLLDACANRDIASYFDNEDLLAALKNLQNNSSTDQYVRASAKKLEQRIAGWKVFVGAFEDESTDFQAVANFIVDLTSEENSTGIWLSCMLLSADLSTKLATASAATQQLPPSLTGHQALPTNTTEFIILVRAVVGIVSVLSAWAWADSLGVDECRERILAVLSLWQDVEGYRDILNHLLHLRQLTRRLGWIISDSNPPRKSGIFAERILMRLAEEPKAILQEEVYKTVQDLKQPLALITEDDRLALRKIAFVAEDGLPAAVEELLFTSDRPFSLRRLRTLRVSMAIIEKEIKEDADNGELQVLKNLWDEDAHGLVPRLVDMVGDISTDITKYFEVEPILEVNHSLLTQLFDTAHDALGLVRSLSIGYPLSSRSLRVLTTAVVDLSTCCRIGEQLFSPKSPVTYSVTSVRTLCLETLLSLAAKGLMTEAGSPNALVILRAALSHPAHSGASVDPVHLIYQTLHIVNRLLSVGDVEGNEPSHWITSVLPKALPELKEFFQLLDLENRTLLFQRLVKLDAGVVGVGEWLLTEELKLLVDTIQDLSASQVPIDYKPFLQHHIVDGIEFLWRICDPTRSEIPTFCEEALQSDEALSGQLLAFLDAMLVQHCTSPSLARLVWSLARDSTLFLSDLRFCILLHLLRLAQVDPTAPGVMDSFMSLLRNLPISSISPDSFVTEAGLALSSFSQQVASLEADTAEAIVALLEWAMNQENRDLASMKGLKGDDFSTLCDFCSMLVPEKEAIISEIRTRITIDEDEIFAAEPVELQAEDICISVNAIETMFQPLTENRPSTPRSGNKTPDILGMVISPPTALLRSPAATGLTKTYANNDFRQLRQAPSARLNTSRLPSMHGAPLNSPFHMIPPN